MANYHIIDRRENPKGKNLPNREKFLKKVKTHIKDQVRKAMGKKSLTDKDGTDITVPNNGIKEPSFEYDYDTGEWDRVLPGNKTFSKGDKVKKPSKSNGGSGGSRSSSGEDEDSFTFTLTRDEYLDIVFDDLELPDLEKTVEMAANLWRRVRSGFRTDGSPNQLDLIRSLKNSLGRRLALRSPVKKHINELEELLATIADGEDKEKLLLEIESLKRKFSAIPWVDQMDLRFRRFDLKPIPNSQAVMFCLMDVSSSMGEAEKEIAKRFYLLLYLFLQRKYEKVQIVFVRHTETASEVNEDEFFHSTISGGTLVSTGIDLVNEIIDSRYNVDAWNIFVVQSSDGDNTSSDNDTCIESMHVLLPKVQHYVYLEIKLGINMMYGSGISGLKTAYEEIVSLYPQLVIESAKSVDTVVDVFRKIFAKKVKIN